MLSFNLNLPYRFIAIEGNIGAGKTSLSQKLAQDFNTRLILEQFSDNPFLPLFYDNPERYAFSVELFFMSERYRQLQEHLMEQDLFQQHTIADYFFIKTLLFAGQTLKGEEYRLFQRFFNILNGGFPKPDLLVYLYRSVEQLLDNIQSRGRDYEQDISYQYLQSIQTAYLDYFKIEEKVPILILDMDGIDFIDNSDHYLQIIDLLMLPYAPGIHHRKVGQQQAVDKG